MADRPQASNAAWPGCSLACAPPRPCSRKWEARALAPLHFCSPCSRSLSPILPHSRPRSRGRAHVHRGKATALVHPRCSEPQPPSCSSQRLPAPTISCNSLLGLVLAATVHRAEPCGHNTCGCTNSHKPQPAVLRPQPALASLRHCRRSPPRRESAPPQSSPPRLDSGKKDLLVNRNSFVCLLCKIAGHMDLKMQA
jgi:hypothetical protein